ncbi:transcriptional regulator, LacI family [Ruaniaceae bacterium KH17]|nr:transcriptional regulator, LacI family [Ruaniaceae bacterium KH17]
MGATIRDVAARAGVSTSTVSRTFGRPEKVDERTREAVLTAARELGYAPNLAARSLVTGRRGQVGVLVPDLTNPFFAAVMRGAAAALNDLGAQALVGDFADDPIREAELIQSMRHHVDGFILCSPRLDDGALATLHAAVPLVLVNRTSPTIPFIHINNTSGIDQSVRHLRALGHQRIGYAAGPEASRSARERLAAFEQADGGPILGHFASTFEGGAQVADAALAAGVTALLAYNDVVAIGAIHRLLGYDAALPARMSIVGFDDIPIARMITPALTTVAAPQEATGAAAARLFMAGDEASRTLDVTLQVRGSTTLRR